MACALGAGALTVLRLVTDSRRLAAWLHDSAFGAGLISTTTSFADKTSLGPLRAVHLLLCVVVIRHISFPPAMWDAGIVKGIIQCGRKPLRIFAAGVLLAYVGTGILMRFASSIVAATSVTFCGCLLLVLFAAGDRNRRLEGPGNSRYRGCTGS